MSSTIRILVGVPVILLAMLAMNYGAEDDAPGLVLIGLIIAFGGLMLFGTGLVAKGVQLGLDERDRG